MSDIEYYRSQSYQDFLMSSLRRNLATPETILSFFSWKGAQNIVDFGCGLGYYFLEFRKMVPNAWIWAGECQEELLDQVLRRKLLEGIENVTPFHLEKSDHPLLPEWIPVPDIIFASLSLSTFPNPGLAMDGLIRSMKRGGKLYIVDWAKSETEFGPSINEKISIDKMKFLAEEFRLKVGKSGRITENFYGLEVTAGTEFVYGYYDLKEETEETELFQM